MTNAKSTKRALLFSVLSLVVCVTMLIGSTFAWFTDSATTGVNKIVAGNLDLKLEVTTDDGNTWTEVDNTTKLFNDEALWEPGYTEVAYLRLSNAGNLAFKYELSVNVNNEIAGKTAKNEDIILSKILKFGVVETETFEKFADRNAAANAATGALATAEMTGTMDKDAAAKYIALAITMPTTVGNEANHNGTDVPSIQLGVNVFATQNTVESDSYDNQYDKDAPDLIKIGETKYATLAEAVDAAKSGATILISGDAVMPSITGAKKLTFKAIEGSKAVINMSEGGQVSASDSTLTFDGIILNTRKKHDADLNGITHAKSTSFNNCTLNGSLTMYGETAKFTNCTFVNYDDYNVWTYGVDVTFKDCTFSTGGKAVLVYTHSASQSTVKAEGCTFNSNGTLATDKAAIEVGDDPSKTSTHTIVIKKCTANGFAPNNSNSPLWGNKDSMDDNHLIVKVDDKLQKAPDLYINTAADLFDFAKEINNSDPQKPVTYAGKTVMLGANIDLKNEAWTPIGQTGAAQFQGTFDGNGYTISNLNIDSTNTTNVNYASGLFGWVESSAVIKNVVIDSATIKAGHYAGAVAGYLTSTAKIESCTVKNSSIIAKHIDEDVSCGDKIGGIVGYINTNVVNNCKVINTTISAARDAGSIVGAAVEYSNVTNCSASKTVLTYSGDCTHGSANTNLGAHLNGLVGRDA